MILLHLLRRTRNFFPQSSAITMFNEHIRKFSKYIPRDSILNPYGKIYFSFTAIIHVSWFEGRLIIYIYFYISFPGRPQPTLTWLINNNSVEDHTVLKNDGKVIVSRIRVDSVNRDWQNTSIRCQATNTALLSPHERTARVEMRCEF